MVGIRAFRSFGAVALFGAALIESGCTCYSALGEGTAFNSAGGGSTCGNRTRTSREPGNRLVLGADVVSALEAGIPVGALNTAVLRFVKPDAGVPIQVWQEFQFAPSMTMVRTTPLVANDFDDALITAGRDPVSQRVDTALPPVERDQVVCLRDKTQALISPASDGTFSMPVLACPFGPPLSIARIRFDVMSLQLTPRGPGPNVPTNAIDVLARLDNISVDLDLENTDGSHTFHQATIGRLDLGCPATFGPPLSGQCGGIPVACGVSSIAITNLHTGFPSFVISQQDIEETIRVALRTGVVLEFESYAPSALTLDLIDPLRTLKLTGTPSNFCRNVAPPQSPPQIPQVGPLRGLVRMNATIGRGEFVGSEGSVMPYDLIPEVMMQWSGGAGEPVFREWAAVEPPDPGQAYRIHASQVARPLANGLPTGIGVSAGVVRRLSSTCWLKPAGLPELLAPAFPPGATRGGGRPISCPNDECSCVMCPQGAKFFLELIAPDGTSVLTRDLRVLGTARVIPETLTSADFALDVAPRLTQLDGPLCPGLNCPKQCGRGTCAPWVRMDLVEDAFPPPPFPSPGGPPWEVVLWAGRSFDAVKHDLGSQPGRCSLNGETIVGTRMVTGATVDFGPLMVDSAQFQADSAVHRFLDRQGDTGDSPTNTYTTGLPPDTNPTTTYRRSRHPDGMGGSAVLVELTEQCEPRSFGRPRNSSNQPCWTSTFTLPPRASVKLSEGYSDTTVPRLPLDTVFNSNSVPLQILLVGTAGNRGGAFHGTLDRSGVRMYTRIPRIYNDIGLTPESFDYRGILEERMAAILAEAATDPNPGPVLRKLPSGAAFLDWEHSPGALTPPYSGGHPKLAQSNWWPDSRSFEYFAEWSTDELMLTWVGAPGSSSCLQPNQLFATPREFTFSGGGFSQPRPVPARVVLDTGTRGGDGEYRVMSGANARGQLRSVVP